MTKNTQITAIDTASTWLMVNGKQYSITVRMPHAGEPCGYVSIFAHWEVIDPSTAHLVKGAQNTFSMSRHVSEFGKTGKKVLAAIDDQEVLAILHAINAAISTEHGDHASQMKLPELKAAKSAAVEGAPYSLTTEQVQARIAGHDLRTYKGWIAAARALLEDAPALTGVTEGTAGQVVLKVDFDGGSDVYAYWDERGDGIYDESYLSDFDSSAWNSEAESWDGVEAAVNIAVLTDPTFVTFCHE